MLEEKPEDYAEIVEEKMLIEYLVAIEDQYSQRFDELVEKQMECEGVDEELKVTDSLKWIGLANNIRSCVKEILIEELCS